MNKQINFRAPVFTQIQLDLLCKKFGIDKTTAIIWSINKMCESNDINNDVIFSEIDKRKSEL